MPSHTFRPLHPRQSLRRLRTAFTSQSPTTKFASTCSTSPLSAGQSASTASSGLAGFSFEFENLSAVSFSSQTDSRRIIRRKKSTVEVEQEEERRFSDSRAALLGLVEPRPYPGPTLGGIEEVLDGQI